jgi:carbonic anhydrase
MPFEYIVDASFLIEINLSILFDLHFLQVWLTESNSPKGSGRAFLLFQLHYHSITTRMAWAELITV